MVRKMLLKTIAVGQLVSEFAAAMAAVKLALSQPGILPAESSQASPASVALGC